MSQPQPTGGDEPTQHFTGGQKVLGRYKLTTVLGRGGMGIVWHATDEELDREVALKFLPAVLVKDRASLEDLKRETKRSLELTHPNIVRTYDFVQDSKVAGISMEYVDGDTLRNRRLDQLNGVFEPVALSEWTKQLSGALDYAHQNAGIVHRDLKPANLMANSRGQLKVADFGISRSLVESVTQITGTNSISGTLVYMSPQQLSGDEPTPLDDVYGVGATLYELLTGRPPFYTGDIVGQVCKKVPASIKERRVALGVAAGELPTQWESAIAACLAKNPAQRPQSAGEIAVRLGLIEAASLSTARPAVPPPPASGIQRLSPGPSSAQVPTAPMLTPGTPAAAPKSSKGLLFAGIFLALAAVGGAGWYYGMGPGANVAESKTTKPVAMAKPSEKAGAARSATPAPSPAGSPLAAPVAEPSPPPVVATGSVFVKTEPEKAKVKIGDAEEVETPNLISKVKVGSQKMVITLPGYKTVEQQLDVKENETTTVPPLLLRRSTGELNIRTVPDEVSFKLKGKDRVYSEKTPWTSDDVFTGEYELTFSRDGWPPQTQKVTVTQGLNDEISFQFVGRSLSITSDPAGAKVMQNNKPITGVTKDGKPAQVTPCVLNDVPPGDAEYTLSKTGYGNETLKVTVPAEGDFTVPSVTLTKNKTASRSSGHSGSSRSKGDDDDKPSSGGGNQWWKYLRGAPAPSGGIPGFAP